MTILVLLLSITGGCISSEQEATKVVAERDPVVARADSLLGHQQFSEALQLLQGALSVNERSVDLHVAMGNTHAHLGVLDSAIAHYRAAVAIDSQCADAWHNLGIILADKGQHHEAVDAVQLAV
ncbi:MAG: tetratricopeptide repeat protein, partial [Gemmatimonadetes bacterium]|nr:tetratricopeptide repeat protein [Gemmatimonadota bacterium]